QLKNKTGALEAQLNADAEKGAPRDPLRQTALQDIERLRDDLTQGIEHFFQFAFYVTFYAQNKEELEQTSEEIENIFGSKLIYSRKVLYQSEQGFNSTLPLGNDELTIAFNMNSSPIAASFPFISAELTSDDGILYGINRHNNSLILFDRFSLQNANMAVFATSGAGKSYATKLEILRSLMFDTDVIVIDPEREYEYLAEAVGGRYFDISLSSDHHINPFDLPIPREDESPEDVLRSNTINLVGLFRLMLGGLSPEEDSMVDRAVSETYAMKDITPDSDFSNIEPPLLSDFEMVLAGMEGSDSVMQRLVKYTKGSWSTFLNRPSNVDINKKFVVFSVRDMEDELKPVAMYIVMHYIWVTVRKNLKKRLLVVDEAWWMMKSEDTASFLYSIAKRGRKYYLGLSTITQDAADFLKSPYGVPIITNSSIQLLLKQSPTTIDLLQRTFNLTDEEKYLLLESNVGEGIFFAGLKHVAIKIIASYTEDQIITSDPSQILSIKKAKQDLERVEEQ
ncbi:MAG: DUF87 domain-containing protein, partial [Patescibacteria group bacterium]